MFSSLSGTAVYDGRKNWNIIKTETVELIQQFKGVWFSHIIFISLGGVLFTFWSFVPGL
jgi:hypothetical protein